MKFDDVSYVRVPEDNECIVNAVQIGKQLDLPPHIIRSWGDEFEEFLYIKKINGRMTYTQKSVEQFEWIKLMRDKGYGIKHIREQLKLVGFTNKDDALGIINPNDVNLMESIKTEIGIELKNQLNVFLNEFLKEQELNNVNLVSDIKTELEQTVQEHLESSMKEINNKLESQIEDNKKLSHQLKSFKEELAVTIEINEKLDNIRANMEERKRKEESEKEQKKGILGWFSKRKE